uniref:uncharacterized protein LOC122604628 n=1 Tax=Erigeron canadensis TaxID=72917 RepID=UPI001CB8E5B2|nr:uncharacterized protein LOC122604628 [Erigeron canadensis]
MASASKFSIKNQTKSISLPCRSHPTTCEIEQLLNKIKTTISSPSAEVICSGLSQVVELYKCTDDLLNSSTTKVLMSNERNKKWVDELVDESMNLLDICGGIREMVSEIKDHIRDIHCVLRRRKGVTVIEDNIVKYNCFRKKMKKDVKMMVTSLKQVDNMIMDYGGSVVVDSDNHHLVALIKAVIGVSETTTFVFESLLLFFCAPVLKPNRWSLVLSKLIHKGMVACEDKQEQGVVVNEFERIESTLRIYGSINEVDDVQIAQCRLERLGAQIENMEIGLNEIYRCLVRTRVSFLNIISL